MTAHPVLPFESAPHLLEYWKRKQVSPMKILAQSSFDWLQETKERYSAEPREQASETPTCRIYAGLTMIDLHRHIFLKQKNKVGHLNERDLIREFRINLPTVPAEERVRHYLSPQLRKLKGTAYTLWEHPGVRRSNSPAYDISPEDVCSLLVRFGPLVVSVMYDDQWVNHCHTDKVQTVMAYNGWMGKYYAGPTSDLHGVVATGWERTPDQLLIKVRDCRGSSWGLNGEAFAGIDRKVGRFELGLLTKKD